MSPLRGSCAPLSRSDQSAETCTATKPSISSGMRVETYEISQNSAIVDVTWGAHFLDSPPRWNARSSIPAGIVLQEKARCYERVTRSMFALFEKLQKKAVSARRTPIDLVTTTRSS
ncbi:hypothetical protein AC579_7133 [Pseudocercospora musae]|uniref:Uncharacterized protein n=1 Tax=Pseudocercospora musae TaxID=113226 RepID=A0A139IMZ3_9PEZI|nr:hypothetical protein AC579_7133 [Pseudocercospora musae]